MDSFNRVVSFILGLVVVLVFFAVITGKINLKSKTASTSATAITPTPTSTQKNNGGLFGFFSRATPTPTVTPAQNPTPTAVVTLNTNNLYNQGVSATGVPSPKTIPSTGLPTLFIPALISGLVGGGFLRKSGKKKD